MFVAFVRMQLTGFAALAILTSSAPANAFFELIFFLIRVSYCLVAWNRLPKIEIILPSKY